MLAVFLAAIPLPLALFYCWGALSPSRFMVSQVTAPQWLDWSSTHHGIVVFGYAALIALIFDCKWPLQHRRMGLFAAVLSAAYLACLVLIPHAAPRSISRLEVPSLNSGWVQWAIAGGLYLWGIFYGLYLLAELWQFRRESLRRFQLATTLLYLLPLLMLGQGAIRYVLPVAPLLILLHVQRGANSPWRVGRMALGCILGLAILLQLPQLPNNIPDLRARIRLDPIFDGHQPP
jgi:hypothetical protein